MPWYSLVIFSRQIALRERAQHADHLVQPPDEVSISFSCPSARQEEAFLALHPDAPREITPVGSRDNVFQFLFRSELLSAINPLTNVPERLPSGLPALASSSLRNRVRPTPDHRCRLLQLTQRAGRAGRIGMEHADGTTLNLIRVKTRHTFPECRLVTTQYFS